MNRDMMQNPPNPYPWDGDCPTNCPHCVEAEKQAEVRRAEKEKP